MTIEHMTDSDAETKGIREPNNTLEPRLIVIRGLPGSGKSTVASELQARMSNKTVLVDPDALDKDSEEYKQFSENLVKSQPSVSEKVHPFRYLLHSAETALKNGNTVIWNQPFTDLDNLEYTIAHLEKQHQGEEQNKPLPVLVVNMEVDPEIAWDRVDKRQSSGGHGMTREKFDSYQTKLQTLNGQFQHQALHVRAEQPVEATVEQVMNHISK